VAAALRVTNKGTIKTRKKSPSPKRRSRSISLSHPITISPCRSLSRSIYLPQPLAPCLSQSLAAHSASRSPLRRASRSLSRGTSRSPSRSRSRDMRQSSRTSSGSPLRGSFCSPSRDAFRSGYGHLSGHPLLAISCGTFLSAVTPPVTPHQGVHDTFHWRSRYFVGGHPPGHPL
jgi:hypothetical protein